MTMIESNLYFYRPTSQSRELKRHEVQRWLEKQVLFFLELGQAIIRVTREHKTSYTSTMDTKHSYYVTVYIEILPISPPALANW
jgi:hypothetical protein